MVNRKRITMLNDREQKSGAVVYWMSRDQRVDDNWALLFAQELALDLKAPLAVVFCLVPEFLGATIRQYGFMLKGLRGVEKKLAEADIPFFLLTGTPGEELEHFLESRAGAALVTDFNPLRIKRVWNRRVVKSLAVPIYEVDAHNIVPCRIASSKQEYGAYTFRPKIRRALAKFLTDFPPLARHPFPLAGKKEMTDWDRVMEVCRVDGSVPEVDWLEPGEVAGRKVLRDFLENRLAFYHSSRNDPVGSGQSGLSPYLHFGQISPQRVALETERRDEHLKSQESFMEELVVRRELSENYCFYNEEYDSFEGFPEWARKSLDSHRNDPREYVYSQEQFEKAETHDQLWNSAQRELVISGKMHGYMRMYWAKKILEWAESPEKAVEYAIRLNDRYGLDGRDPNGYAGIAWSIGGVHDRAWKDRPVFGKIRYMSLDGCRRKFDVKAYIEKWE
jgi:deoxyribodipyrimidine photo-lyase